VILQGPVATHQPLMDFDRFYFPVPIQFVQEFLHSRSAIVINDRHMIFLFLFNCRVLPAMHVSIDASLDVFQESLDILSGLSSKLLDDSRPISRGNCDIGHMRQAVQSGWLRIRDGHFDISWGLCSRKNRC
jgi:hypothetical protein